MGLFGRKKRKTPTSDAAQALDAIADLKEQHDRKNKRRSKVRRRILLPAWLDSRLIVGVLVIVVAVIADGVRRENQEFYATITNATGNVQYFSFRKSATRAAAVGAKLEDRDMLATGQNSSAILEFPDGSVLTLGPQSQVEVKLLDYNRGSASRTRTFFLRAGQIWAHVGPHFGEKSEMRIYTPSSVAAVRGTIFSVMHSGDTCGVSCTRGAVEACGFTGHSRFVTPNSTVSLSAGTAVSPPQQMSATDAQSYRQAILYREIPPEHWLKTLELTITQTLAAPLDILGIGKASWGVGAANFARRAAAQEQLRKLHGLLEGYAAFPAYLNPGNLEGLNISADGSRAILSKLHGNAIEFYRSLQGGRSYVLFARARDPQRTVYMVTPEGVRNSTEEEMRQYISGGEM